MNKHLRLPSGRGVGWLFSVLALLGMSDLAAQGRGGAGADELMQFPTTQPANADAPHATPMPQTRGIEGSKHDFTDGGRLPRDLCLPCHTPHISASEAPLLVKPADARTQTRAYRTRVGDLDAASLICLSCHDGSVGPDVYAGTHAMSWSEVSGGVTAASVRLTSHPIGIRYPDHAERMNSPAAVTASGKLKLPDGRIQCTTCHDPHNTERNGGMLRMSNARSQLCLTCHRI
ncbi:MAG: cytochrome c3 family protein [Phycisphaerae bacterium]